MSTGINIASSSGITVGTTAVTSGTNGRVFFQAGGVVQQDGNFTYDNTLKRLELKAVGTAATDIPFTVQNSAGTANLIKIAGNNTMTFLSSGGKIIFSQDTVGQGSVISLRRDFTNQEIIRLDGTNGGGITINPLNDGSTKSVAIGSIANGISMWSTGTNSHNFQIKNSFHNLFHVVGDPNSAIATFRLGTNASNTNFFNIHGRNAGGTGLTTNPIFTINSSGTVGIGTEASTPGARLDVRAQGALSTDIAFRVRNSADSANIITANGTGEVFIGSGIAGAGQGHLFNIRLGASTASPFAYFDNNVYNFDIDRFCNIKLGFAAQNTNSTQSIALGLGSVPSSRNYQQTVAFWTAVSQGTNDSGFAMSGADTAGNNAVYTNYYGRNIVLGGTTQGTGTRKIVLNNGTSPSTDLTDAFQQYSSDITAGNAAPHFRTENGAIVKVYQETTGVGASTFVTNTSGILNDTATFDGYTIGQVVKALRNLGILA